MDYPTTPPSRPQLHLLLIVREKYPDAEIDYHVYTLEGKDRFIDIAIPSLTVAIEYDGWDFHGGAGVIKRRADKVRVKELEDVGWRTIRVNKHNVLRFLANMKSYVEGGERLFLT